MKKFLINSHSFVDVITNSSTELFVINSEKSVELIKEICEDLIATYNKSNSCTYTFSGCFNEPYIVDENNINDIIENLQGYDNDIPDSCDMKKTSRLEYRFPWDENREYNEQIDQLIEQKVNDKLKEVMPKLKEKYLGKIILMGADDNSIPWPIQDYLESLFGSRMHLG